MIIRNAKPEDAAPLQAIRQLDEQLIAYRLTAQAQGIGDFLVVETAMGLTSFVFLKYFGKETYPHIPDIEDLYTKAEERGKGYATALLHACESRARARGFAHISLAAGVDPTDPARRLYEKLGYSYDGKVSYVDGVYNGVPDWVIDMIKELK
ncbi:MAG: GNAT family N-acetyltransferase [Caldilinea sp. CFX5]|nr:GNAT family N-acetyltransferase [Caldilinea sp. CFX5]